MEEIDSPYINRYESRSIQEPGSINILSTTIPSRTPQLMFDSIPSRTPSQTTPQLPPPDGSPRLPVIEHTSPHPIITAYQPLMKPSFQNYNKTQKQRLKAFVDIKVSVAEKKAKLADFEGVADDPNYKNVSHLFGIIDKLEIPERNKLRNLFDNVLKQNIPITKCN
jgi:hypothetical protein